MKKLVIVGAVMACACGSPSSSDGGSAAGGSAAGGSAAGGSAAGGSAAGGSAAGGAAAGGSAAGGAAAGGAAAGGSAAGGSAAGGSAAGGSAAGGSAIGACPTVTTSGIPPLVLECPPALPMNVGGTIVAGTYRSRAGVLGLTYQFDAGTGVCAGPPVYETFRIRFATTSNPRVLDYEFARAFILPDGGAVPGIGAGRGVATISTDGRMIGFGAPTCSLTDAGVYDLGGEPRVFVATPTTFAFDCCRTTSPDAGGAPLDSTNAYMISLTRE